MIKIQKHEDVGINTIRDLSKEELIECITHTLEHDHSAKFLFERKLLYIAEERREKKLKEDEAKGDKWLALEKEYAELLKPYSGMKWKDVPTDVITKAAEISKAAKKAQEEYFDTFESRAGAI